MSYEEDAVILETDRLSLRQLTEVDFDDLASLLQDPRVMYAYEHAFSDDEVRHWLENQRRRYREDGFGLWAVVERESGLWLGQAGLTLQDYHGKKVPEIGYLLKYEYWGRGYATEAAVGCREYAFHTLGLERVYSIIRDNNPVSQRVALRVGMMRAGSCIKHYYNMDMLHYVYSVEKETIGKAGQDCSGKWVGNEIL